MKNKDYYSVRTGKITPDEQVYFDVLKRQFMIIFDKLQSEGFFQKYFGIYCEDGYISGELGEDIETIMFVVLKKDNLYPIRLKLPGYTEDDFFDVIEFLHDKCSKGLNGHFHDWNNCGYHYEEFNDVEGQKYFREQLNPILKEYKDGFELSENGEVLVLSDSGLSNLFVADIPTSDTDNIKHKIDSAILKFRQHKSTLDDRRDAIRELADVLEFLRPSIAELLVKKDENDIFNIANNFGIRHHNIDQKTDYDKAIWYSWIFYFYLATLHAVLRMVNKGKNKKP